MEGDLSEAVLILGEGGSGRSHRFFFLLSGVQEAANAEMYDAVYLLAPRGVVLLSRTYGSREVPAAHVKEFEQALFSRLYIHSVPPVVCVGSALDRTTFIYASVGGVTTHAEIESVNATYVGVEASLQRTDAALRQRGSGGIVGALACRGNPNAVLALVLLRRLLLLLQECAARAAPTSTLSALGLRRQHADLDDAFILSHADVVYEILDEAIDGGVPQTSDPKVLLLFAEANAGLPRASSVSTPHADKGDAGMQLAAQATGMAPWRRPGVRYRKNEVYIDVVEKVHALVAQNGSLLRQEVEGRVLVRCLLSGMPECKLATNEGAPHAERMQPESARIQAITNTPLPGAASEASKHTTGGPLPGQAEGGRVVAQRAAQDNRARGGGPPWAKATVRLAACRYHPCVRLSKHAADKVIAFSPPDGECELMTYRCTEDVALPFKVCPFFYEKKKGQFEYLVFLKAIFSRVLTALNRNVCLVFQVIVPTPPEVSAISALQTSWGKAKLDSSQMAVVWKLSRFPGGSEYLLRFLLEVSGTPSPVRGPLRINFTIPGMTASGLCIRYLRVVEKSNYAPAKWIRYLTQAGDYEHRL
ncbi:hypothetical protein Efla_002162 [Eimeria flavescens]